MPSLTPSDALWCKLGHFMNGIVEHAFELTDGDFFALQLEPSHSFLDRLYAAFYQPIRAPAWLWLGSTISYGYKRRFCYLISCKTLFECPIQRSLKRQAF